MSLAGLASVLPPVFLEHEDMLNRSRNEQRLAALKKAVERKHQFGSVAELRKSKQVTILSHLVDFQCATSQNLLELLDQKNNSILTSMVKDGLIKIKRWQNMQVYVPTSEGKAFLLRELDDEAEIQRIKNTPIKRRITGHSSEHDVLLQTATIKLAKELAAKNGLEWRVKRPRKTIHRGKLPDAQIIFPNSTEPSIYIELERTKKNEVELICSMRRMTELLYQRPDRIIILCAKRAIYEDYSAAIFAMSSDMCGLYVPHCEFMAPLQRYGIGASWCLPWMNESMSQIDVLMIDQSGQIVQEVDDLEKLIFSPIFWQVALRQEEQDWRGWVRHAADTILEISLESGVYFPFSENEMDEDLFPVLTPDALKNTLPFKVGQRRKPCKEDFNVDAYALKLIEAFGGPIGEDNPMRSQEDRKRAWERWVDFRRSVQRAWHLRN